MAYSYRFVTGNYPNSPGSSDESVLGLETLTEAAIPTIAMMPARIGSGRVGQAAARASKPGSGGVQRGLAGKEWAKRPLMDCLY
jgi:hypothetical protein